MCHGLVSLELKSTLTQIFVNATPKTVTGVLLGIPVTLHRLCAASPYWALHNGCTYVYLPVATT